MNKQRIRTSDGSLLSLRSPWIGAIEPIGVTATGGFFFISPVMPPGSTRVALALGPASAVPGRPDLKLFRAPDAYPVRGYDFTAANAYIDWAKFGSQAKLRFAYVRASSWGGIDRTFSDRWTNLQQLGVDRGAFHKFDFCHTPDDQLRTVMSVVPVGSAELPFAVQLVTPNANSKDPAYDPRQLACYTKIGRDEAKRRILALAFMLQDLYGKTPMLYGNRYNLGQLTDGRANAFMLWLSTYSSSGRPDDASLKLPGRNPWTFWQYTSALDLPGVGKGNEADVFFGTTEQYELFKAGKGNVALAAAR